MYVYRLIWISWICLSWHEFFVSSSCPCAIFLLLCVSRTVSIECCYQNVGIASSIALAMFEGDDLAEAMGAPVFYGLVEAVVLGIYCIGAWKCGWSKAPANENFCTVISTSYEVLESMEERKEAIEISIGEAGSKTPYNEFGESSDTTTWHYTFWLNGCCQGKASTVEPEEISSSNCEPARVVNTSIA